MRIPSTAACAARSSRRRPSGSSSDSARSRHELSQRATVDPLTGALNRAGSDVALAAAFATPGTGVAVLFVDFDDVKAGSDAHGHEAGDLLLVEAAALGSHGRAAAASAGRSSLGRRQPCGDAPAQGRCPAASGPASWRGGRARRC